MKIPLIIVFLIFLNGQEGYFCSCGGKYDSKYFKEQIERADFVFVGKPIKNVGVHSQRINQLDEEGIGYNVLFKVDSVIKGELKSQEVIIDQWNDGSCANTFKIGEKYIVFGIDYKMHWGYEETIEEEMKLKKEGYEEFTQFDYYTLNEDKYNIINTNYCSSFVKRKSILKYLK
ncbi:hypothetical protein ACFSKL_15445 [Belliella marina]|uniref:Tissue inhibitor of metalloproteinase n=1 Tax=Belliella marina TaxID=1644146 RepID=A0ABW4VN85_9BACT